MKVRKFIELVYLVNSRNVGSIIFTSFPAEQSEGILIYCFRRVVLLRSCFQVDSGVREKKSSD